MENRSASSILESLIQGFPITWTDVERLSGSRLYVYRELGRRTRDSQLSSLGTTMGLRDTMPDLASVNDSVLIEILTEVNKQLRVSKYDGVYDISSDVILLMETDVRGKSLDD